MLVRTRILSRMVVLAAALSLGWTSWPEPPRAPVVVPVPADADAAAQERAIDRAVELAEARRLGWVQADPVIGRRLVANLRFLGRTGPEPALLEEAYALGMDLTDPVVTGRLLDRMDRMLGAPPAAPTDAELQATLEIHADDLRSPDRVRVRQVFLAHSRHKTLDADATAALAALRAGQEVAGDALLDLPATEDTTPARLTARYGATLGDAVAAAPVGQWTGPVRSPFGLHLIRVDTRTPGELPALDEVREALAQAWVRDHTADWRASRLADLRSRWPIDLQVTP